MISQQVSQTQTTESRSTESRSTAVSTLAPNTPILKSNLNDCIVEAYHDEVLINPTDLLYGENAYPLQDVLSIKTITLRRRKLGAKRKNRKLLGLATLVLGLILAFSSLSLAIRILGVIGATLSAICFLIFYLVIGERKWGKYGLLLEIRAGRKHVLTSHNMKAIQKLYYFLAHRLQQYPSQQYRAQQYRPQQCNLVDETLIVNMYTGEVSSVAVRSANLEHP
ncbi:MAG: DUF6232 family protein [Cyanobacteria bacterium P01_A01_bin.114]